MKSKTIRAIGAGILLAVWAFFTMLAWFSPQKEMSDSERRKLAKAPKLSLQALLDGKFMSDFEDYSLDQFPFRDDFRKTKALYHHYVLGQKDNNEIYLAQGHLAKLDYPEDLQSVDYAAGVFQGIYRKYLQDSGCTVFAAVIPDKGYYVGAQNGFPVMDYGVLMDTLRQKMPYATHIDLTDCLTSDSYYLTDSHWKQEKLLPVAQKLSSAMGLTQPEEGDFTVTKAEVPFYGVYAGQAMLPAEADTIYLMENEITSGCTVLNHETGKTTAVYDLEKLAGKDPYEVYLSGPQALLTIQNPNAKTDRELVIFRDSFGSSIAPLLLRDYKTVTMVDIRYLPSAMLERYMTFRGQDVLFLYSTGVLNNANTLR